MSMNDDVTAWRYLADEAKAGRLYLDASVATECRDACNRQIDLYEGLREQLKQVRTVTGFGRFDCSELLAQMLGAKAIGGAGDVDTALKEHIEVVGLIRETIEVSVARYETQQQEAKDKQDQLLN
ncbi:hypothetical protein [Nocardia sp. NPDC005366]|uniref:hypothetical protein n=1 Tax=Nocardia sp. NPDC005366 TaxID=3156878 RepID=UPI0033BDFD1E